MFALDSELLQLLQLITVSTHTVAKAYSDANLPHPSANDGTARVVPEVAQEPAVLQATLILVAACKQLIASVASPSTLAKDASLAVCCRFLPRTECYFYNRISFRRAKSPQPFALR